MANSEAKILFFSGSSRKESWNAKLAAAAANKAEELGAKTTLISLANYEMPLYNGDLEEASGVPETAKELKKLFLEHNGIFIASPEYNGFFPPLIKNTFDWLSRLDQDGDGKFCANTAFALASTSPGRLGGIRGMSSLRLLLGIGYMALVIPEQVGVPNATSAFDESGKLTDEMSSNMLQGQLQQLIKMAQNF